MPNIPVYELKANEDLNRCSVQTLHWKLVQTLEIESFQTKFQLRQNAWTLNSEMKFQQQQKVK